MYEPAGSSNSAMAVVVPGGGMGGNMVAGRPQPPPELSALSVTAGPHCGGTSIWVQGAHFCGTTQVYIGGALAPQLAMVNENLLTLVSPPASSDGGDVTVDIMATNSDIFGAGHAPVFSNALRFTYSSSVPASGLPMVALAPATADAAETQTAERALALLAQHAAPHMPVAGDENLLTSASLPRDQRLFAAALAVVLGKQPGVAKAENGESPLDRRDDQSRTLLHYCAALKNAPAVELLLRAGASTAVQDAAGQTPLELARAFGWVQGETLLAPVAASTNGTTPMAGAAVAMIDETAAVSVVDASIPMDATAEVQVQVAATEVAPTTGAPEVGALLGLGVAP
ncbi:hypothetical protein EMIHUDRAFT_356406 [Emiliania huxleyi CCMP1516]|uniref:IPT/TIG domain-containing protein n=2 Tax=Emiliania huxleyi TaxID=2903 RepID=A0A0D3IVJ1_EMIH1|nr:hypothetical protein EMIHUDRAFT_356406 [Emiliania huxleyi CCMP1516]EOD15276.1 hypothetical protein EMIHUDRAFT_356406 [Emiliania huxleyi CCMP1516]|eukprot:XP_005767705.1 hypothetical protein EMIHUDRAFT_356406 [Emiliania huxleyi CCMP1516]